MDRRLSYSARFPTFTSKDVYRALGDRTYWDALIEEMRTYSPGEVRSFHADGEGIEVALRHVLPREQLPEMAQTFQRGDMTIERVERFGPYAPETHGSYTATLPAAPGDLGGAMRLFETDTGSTLRITSTAKVNILFMGARLEQMILVNLIDLFRIEAAFTNAWLGS
jgi:hypothetical protein